MARHMAEGFDDSTLDDGMQPEPGEPTPSEDKRADVGVDADDATRLMSEDATRQIAGGETQLMPEDVARQATDGETGSTPSGETVLPRGEGETQLISDDETVLLPSDEGETVLLPSDEDETVLLPDDEDETVLLSDDEEETRLVPDAGRFDRIGEGAGETELMPTPIEEDASDPRVQTMRMIPATRDALYNEEVKEQKKKSHRRLIAVFLLMIVLISAAAAFVSYGAELWGGKTVPNVVGRGQEAATAALEDKGFQVSVTETASDEQIGKVLSQSPKAGERLDQGGTVTIEVAVARVMPDVTGMSIADAEAALREAGATEFATSAVSSDQPAGTVLGTQPEAGAAFKSHDTITVIVAQAYTVPDLVGQKDSDAVAALESLGLTAKVTYTQSDKDDHIVLSLDPAAGSEITQGSEVRLEVAQPYPDDIHDLADYTTHAPADISKWLGKQGFACQGGTVDSSGYAAATYSDGSAAISFTSTPFVNSIDLSDGNQGDVLAKGKWFKGVRYEFGADEQPSGASALSDDAVREVMVTCGLDNMTDACTEDSVILPEPATAEGHTFVCAYGEMGDSCWTVLIEATDDGTTTVVTYAPKSIYDAANLESTGGRICDYVAYMYLYS